MKRMRLNNNPTNFCQRVSYRQQPDPVPVHRSGMGNEKTESAASGDGIIICKKLILGCRPEEPDDFRPYVFEPTWRVYIKARDNVDMGAYVKRVSFRMSPRLPLRLQVADASPFEITEVLSTDFPLELKVDYLDDNMSSTIYTYKPNDAFDGVYNVDERMNFQGHERRDKMFFMNPSAALQLKLNTPFQPEPPRPLPFFRPPLKAKTQKGAKKQKSGNSSSNSNSNSNSNATQVVRTPTKPQPPRPIFNIRFK